MNQRCVLSSSSYTAREGARGQRRNKRCRKWMACVRFEYLMIHYANPHRLLLQTPYNEENYFSFFFSEDEAKIRRDFKNKNEIKTQREASRPPSRIIHHSIVHSLHIYTPEKKKNSAGGLENIITQLWPTLPYY